MVAKALAGVSEYRSLRNELKSAPAGSKKGIQDRMKELEPLLKYRNMSSQHFSMGSKLTASPDDLVKEMSGIQRALSGAGTSGSSGSSARLASVSHQQDTTDSIKKVDKTLKKGVSLAKPSSAYSQSTTDSTLAAIRKGLFEYYLYSNMDPSRMLSFAQQGIDPMSAIAALPQAAASMGSVEGGFGQLLKPNARGGIVSGLVGNMAKVNSFPPAPAGEGWAAVRPGETISPGGGGGKNVVELRLKGDLGKFIDARVIDGTAEFQRNRRLR